MILNRAAESVSILKSNGEYDEYGTKTAYKPLCETEMYITIYSQKNTEDARYKDVTHVGYTSLKDFCDDTVIKTADGKTYKALLVNNYARRTVVFLKEVQG